MEGSNIQYNQDGISVSLKIADSDDEETRFETKANSAVTRFATCLSEGIEVYIKNLKERPSIEFLTQFGLKKYTGW